MSSPRVANGSGRHLRPKPKGPPVITMAMALDELFKYSNLPTIPTQFSQLNEALGGGLISGQSAVLPGATGAGKSSLLGALALHVAKFCPVIIATYELPVRIFCARMGGQELNQPWLRILRAGCSRPELDRVLPGSVVFLWRPSFDELEGTIKLIQDQEGQSPLVLLDYLQIMTSIVSTEDPRIATAQTSAIMRDMADRTKTALLLAAAVSRQNSTLLRTAKRTSKPSDLQGVARDVSNVEYDAAAVLALAVSSEVDEHTGLQRGMMAVSKNRFGPSDMIGLAFHGQSGRWWQSSVSLEPTAEEQEEQRACILASLRHSKEPLPKSRIFERGKRKWVEGRRSELVTLVDAMFEEGLIEKVEGGRHPLFTIKGRPKQLIVPGTVPGTVGNDGNG